jgi:hypothetical protein
MILPLIVVIVLISAIVRLITLPFRYGYRHRYFYGYDNPYRYGCRRHHRFLGGLFPILVLVALDRIFTRRY